MKKLIGLLIVAFAATSAYAADDCAAKAAEKKLAGAAKNSFMKKCTKDAGAAPENAACAVLFGWPIFVYRCSNSAISAEGSFPELPKLI